MRGITAAVLGLIVLTCLASASPWETKSGLDRSSEDYTEPRTFTALKEFFRPWYNWFRNVLPKKTPKDLVTSVKETVRDVKEWADESKILHAAKKAIQPVHQWIKVTGNKLKDTTFGEMYDDTKTFAKGVDNSVGGFIERTG